MTGVTVRTKPELPPTEGEEARPAGQPLVMTESPGVLRERLPVAAQLRSAL